MSVKGKGKGEGRSRLGRECCRGETYREGTRSRNVVRRKTQECSQGKKRFQEKKNQRSTVSSALLRSQRKKIKER